MDKKAGRLLIAGGFAGILLGSIAKPPEAGPGVGFYIGAPLIGAGGYLLHHESVPALIYRQPRGQSPADGTAWRKVQDLHPGTPIKVVMKDVDVEGTLVAANADLLVIRLKNGDFSVDRTSIKRLNRRLAGSNRWRNIRRGVGWGLVAGLLRSGVACDGCSAFGGSLITAQSIVIGTVVGATSSAPKWETVYRPEK